MVIFKGNNYAVSSTEARVGPIVLLEQTPLASCFTALPFWGTKYNVTKHPNN
jgi:hypothetical protein